MNLLFAVNHRYVKPLCVLLTSISKNNKCLKNVFLPYAENNPFTAKEIKMIKRTLNKNDNITFVKLPITTLIDITDKKRWDVQIWFKITSLFYIDRAIDKILFIDSDVIVNGDITSFYNQDISNYSFVGVDENNPTCLKRLGLNDNDKYVCAGFLLINPNAVRKRVKDCQTLKIMIKTIPFELRCDEQDFINYYFQKTIYSIKDRRYNFFATWSTIQNGEIITIFHYAGDQKPWLRYHNSYKIEYFYIYWRYAIHIFGFITFIKLLINAYYETFKKRFLKMNNKSIGNKGL